MAATCMLPAAPSVAAPLCCQVDLMANHRYLKILIEILINTSWLLGSGSYSYPKAPVSLFYRVVLEAVSLTIPSCFYIMLEEIPLQTKCKSN